MRLIGQRRELKNLPVVLLRRGFIASIEDSGRRLGRRHLAGERKRTEEIAAARMRSSLEFRSLCEFVRCRKIVLRMVLRDADFDS